MAIKAARKPLAGIQATPLGSAAGSRNRARCRRGAGCRSWPDAQSGQVGPVREQIGVGRHHSLEYYPGDLFSVMPAPVDKQLLW